MITDAQIKALRQIDDGFDFSGIRSATFGALKDAGYITMTFGDVSETYRPSRSWSTTRWTRTRNVMKTCTITKAGKALLAGMDAAK